MKVFTLKVLIFIILIVFASCFIFSCMGAPSYQPTKESSTDFTILDEDEE